jgi:parallel beta-helix repeat protein
MWVILMGQRIRTSARICAAIIALALPLRALAETVRVAGYGVDGPGCGSAKAPCETLGYAIALSAAGDTVLVGPGYYQEPGAPCGATAAMVCVDKSIRVLSTDGAASTVVDADVGAFAPDAVAVLAPDVVLGAPHRGFTIRSRDTSGVRVEAPRVRIAGNLLTGALSGVLVYPDVAEGALLERNLAYDNNRGFVMFGSNQLRNSTASSNGFGFVLGGPSGGKQVVRGAVAVANEAAGFYVTAEAGDTGGVGLARSSAIGNGVGVEINGAIPGLQISGNNLYGNTGQCGLEALNGALVEAPRNFWGTASGPGSDPADPVCADATSSASGPRPARRAFGAKGVGAIP